MPIKLKQNQIMALYESLRSKYKRPRGQWSAWCKRPKTEREKEWVIIESILTQRTNWRNVELVMSNLKKAQFDSLRKIADSQGNSRNRLVSLMRPSGFYKQKAKYLVGLAKFVIQNGGIKKISKIPISDLRFALLRLKGIGPETADSILLYALGKPVFVIDEYTRRLLTDYRLQTTAKFSYEELRRLFEKNLRRDYRLYQDFHALIVLDGKTKSN